MLLPLIFSKGVPYYSLSLKAKHMLRSLVRFKNLITA